MNRSSLTLAAALTALSVPAASAQDFGDVRTVVIDDAIAAVTIERARGDAVTVRGLEGPALTLDAAERGGTLRIAGPETLDEEAFWDSYMARSGDGIRIGRFRFGTGNGRSITIKNGRDERFDAMLDDYPDLTIAVPEGTDLRFEDSALRLSGDVTLGRVEADGNLYMLARLGDADSADVQLAGPGRLNLAAVTGLMDAELSGSGDIGFERAGSAVLTLRGSGDIEGGEIAGDTALSLRGSGDIEVTRIDGDAQVGLQGSGDIETGPVAGRLDAALSGSGDIEVERVDGSAYVETRGSGSVEIGEGRASPFEASVTGSGDIEFGGLAIDPVLRTRGSGGIDVDRSEGQIDASGRSITVGGKRYGQDD